MTTQPLAEYEVEPQLTLVRDEIPEKLGELSVIYDETLDDITQQRAPERHVDPSPNRLAHKNLLSILQMVSKGYELPKDIKQADGELFLDMTLGLIAQTQGKTKIPLSEKEEAIKLFARGYTDQKVSELMGGARTRLALQVNRFNTLGLVPKAGYKPHIVHNMLKEFVAVKPVAPKRERAARAEASPLIKLTKGIIDLESLTETQQPQFKEFMNALFGLRDAIWDQTAKVKHSKPSQVLGLALEGKSKGEIAEQLGTAQQNVGNALNKFLPTLDKYGFGQQRLSAAWAQFSQDPTISLQQLLPLPRVERSVRPAKEYVSGEESVVVKEIASGIDPVRAYLNECGKTPLLTAEQEVELSKQIEAGLFAAHLLADGTSRSPAQQRDLQILVKEGERAKSHFIQANLRLVVSLARKYQGKGLDLLDLIQEGNLGLIRGIEKFDYKTGYKFSTYGTWWIRQSLQRAIADKATSIRIPVHMLERVNKVVKTRSVLASELGREATLEEIGARTKLTVDDVSYCIDIARSTISLNAKVGNDEAEFGDFIKDTARSPEDIAMDSNRQQDVEGMFELLNEREQIIVRARFGFDSEQKTLEEAGKLLGLTRERVRQIERDAMAKLRNHPRVEALREYIA